MVVQGCISFLSLELEEYFLSCNNSESLVTAFIINVMRNIYTHIYMYEQLMLGTIVSKNFSTELIFLDYYKEEGTNHDKFKIFLEIFFYGFYRSIAAIMFLSFRDIELIFWICVLGKVSKTIYFHKLVSGRWTGHVHTIILFSIY